MREIKFVINDPDGIHARPAGQLVKTASKFSSEINIAKDGKTVSAKKIFGIMGLAAKQGEEITITINGPDESSAADELKIFLKSNL